MDKVALGMLMIAVAGIIFHAGQVAQRVTALEQWRVELREDMTYMRAKIDEIAKAVMGGAD